MKIIVIILNWNGREDTLRCLSSLRLVTVPHSVVVVDNGSTDDSVQAIAQAFPEVHIIETGVNLGYAEGNNAGLRHALDQSPDAILILNNDTMVDPQVLGAFLKRDLPIQGGQPHQMQDPSLLDHLGGMWNSRTGRFDVVGAKEPALLWTEPRELDYVSGCALFIKAEVFRRVGLFDARFFLFWEECDWCFRAARAGYRSSTCPEAIVYHRGSASFVGGTPHSIYYWWRNRLLWMELHCSRADRVRLMFGMLPELLLTFQRYLIKSLQRCVSRSTPRRRMRLRTYRATLAGVLDYFLRRFGSGPPWLLGDNLPAEPRTPQQCQKIPDSHDPMPFKQEGSIAAEHKPQCSTLEANSVTEAPPSLSVVMPVRNGATYLELAVRSVLEQTFADFEFIIIDDGSSDRTPVLLQALAAMDARIHLMRTSGEGIVAALNLGVATARGALIARMDADDIALPERFAVQVEALRSMLRLVALGGGAITIDAQGNETGRMPVTAAAMAELIQRNSFLHPTMMMRREAVVAAGLYRAACIYAEDYDLWLRLSEIGEMSNLLQPLIKFRIHSLQTSKTKRLTQRAATAFARQMAMRRRSGQAEGADMTLPLHTSLVDFLRQRAEGREEMDRNEGKDIEIMLREVHNELDTMLVKKLIRMLRSGDALKGGWLLPFKLAMTKWRPASRS